MTQPMSIKRSALAIACALALGLTAGAVRAQAANPDAGYLTSTRGAVTQSAFGLCWRAGSHPDAQSISQCEPAAVAAPIAIAPPRAPEPAPAAPPVVVADVAPVAPPLIERLTLDADALFDFDRSVLRPAGRTALDEFVGRMKEMNPEMIMAIGHTDRLGSATYNQHLSERRVAAVKTYLVGLGIGSDRVQTEGRGETAPVTKSGQCDGARTAAVIACLQPDRRVVVEVMGNRTAKTATN